MLPGLIDCHVHLTAEFGPLHKMETVEETPAAVALHAAAHARKTLEAGFTTVRDLGDMGGCGDAIFALRNAVAKGYVPGPRIFAAGSIISPTGGHGMACGFRDDINLLLDSTGRADGVDGCRAAVRRQVVARRRLHQVRRDGRRPHRHRDRHRPAILRRRISRPSSAPPRCWGARPPPMPMARTA